MNASFWRSDLVRSPGARLLVLALLAILLASLVVVAPRLAPGPAPKPDRFQGAVAANLTSGTDPVPPACDGSATSTTEVTAVPVSSGGWKERA